MAAHSILRAPPLRVKRRVASKEDFPELVRIEATLPDRSDWPRRWTLKEYAEYLRLKDRAGTVAVSAGCGCLLGGMLYRVTNGDVMIDRLLVDPEFARRGVGRQLLSEFLPECSVWAWAYETDLARQLFLRSQGFRCNRIDQARTGPVYVFYRGGCNGR